MLELLIWSALGLGFAYLLVKLVIRQSRHKKLLAELITRKGWMSEPGMGRALPEMLLDQTFPSLGDPVNDHTFDIYRKITGQHRGRDFLLLSRRQKPIKRTEVSDLTYVFTRLNGRETYPLFGIRPTSKLLDAIEIAERGIAEINGVEMPRQIPLSSNFNAKHTVLGTEGTREILSPSVQEALLANPDIFQREDEKWYQRFNVIPGTTENFAWINFSSVDPHTIENRLDALMDFAEIIEATPDSTLANAV
ncbi:MAG: hypothetical protein ACU0GG_05640 [Paracoccaceae bacterium]